MKNRAAYMVGLNKMEIRETPVPEPKAGEVLVKIEYVGICGSDVHYFKDGRCGDFVVDGELMLGHGFPRAETAGNCRRTSLGNGKQRIQDSLPCH